MTMKKRQKIPILVERNAIIYIAHITVEFRVGRMENRCIEVENLYIK